MKLKNKLLAPIIALIISFCILLFALKIVHQDHSKDITNKRAIEFQSILVGLLELKNQAMCASIKDNSYWDEMVDFLKTSNQKWLEDTILPSYQNYGSSYLLMYDKSGKLVSELKSEEKYHSIHSVIENQKLFDGNRSFDKKFYIKSNNDILFVYATTVHFTKDEKKILEPEGYLIGVKILDKSFFEDISKISTHSIFIATNLNEEYDFLFPLKDTHNKTIGNIGVKLNSDLSQTIKTILDYQFVFIVLASIVFLLCL